MSRVNMIDQDLYSTTKDTKERVSEGHQISVREFVKSSFREHRVKQSSLSYHPTERELQKSVISWKVQPPKTTFLDPVIKIEKSKKVDMGKYAVHSDWMKDQMNPVKQGHNKKAVFQNRERPLVTNELV